MCASVQNFLRAGAMIAIACQHSRCPMTSIHDPSFRYPPSFSTDLKKTFAKVRRARRTDSERTASASVNIVPILKRNGASRG